MNTERIFHPPIPTRIAKAVISAHAERVATAIGFRVGDSIFETVSRLGGEAIYRDVFDDEFPESIEVNAQSDFKIFLPSMTSIERDRFTIAHELGHYFLHFPLVQAAHPGDGMRATRWVDETNADLQRTEWEANWFAAGFVMPEAAFRIEYQRSGASGAANLFEVSMRAAEVRAKSLGLTI